VEDVSVKSETLTIVACLPDDLCTTYRSGFEHSDAGTACGSDFLIVAKRLVDGSLPSIEMHTMSLLNVFAFVIS